MSWALHSIFWIALLIAVFSYLIYPISLRLLPSRPDFQPHKAVASWPSMSIIVTVHNEEDRLGEKLENILGLDKYPGAFEVLVASDASNDGTDDIARKYTDRGVRLVRNADRQGKEAAQALAIDAAEGEVLVFSDVSTSMRGCVLSRIAAYFEDPKTGAISSTDAFLDKSGNVSGEGAYVRYEMWLRRQESRVNSLVGLSGSFFAVRASICRTAWQTDIPSDFMSAINCVREGFIAKTADDVVGYYPNLADPSKEYQRKVRTVARGIAALAHSRDVLNPFKYGLFAYQVWGHKVLRWLVPWALVGVLFSNALLVGEHPLYTVTLVAQVLLYLLAIVGWLQRDNALSIARIPYYFASANVAVAHAGVNFLRGKKYVNWIPSKR